MELSNRQESHSEAPSDEEVQLTKLERAFIVGIVGCLLFATWQLGDWLVQEVLSGWVGEGEFREDVIYYGVAFVVSIAALVGATRSAFRVGRFGHTLNRALLWYGALLLISVSGMGTIEYLPEVAAGLVGAGILIAAVYVLQRRYFTQEHIVQRRLRNDTCPECGSNLPSEAHFCPQCSHQVGSECPECGGHVTQLDSYCSTCGAALDEDPA